MWVLQNKHLRMAAGVMPLQALIIGANFVAGLVLARGLAPEDRGAVAVASITLGLATIIAGAGLAEVTLVYVYVPRASSGAIRGASLWACLGAVSSALLLVLTGIADVQDGAMIAVNVVVAVIDLHLLSRLQLSTGTTTVVRMRATYAVFSALTICIVWALVGLSPSAVFLSWLLAESLLCCSCLALIARQPQWPSEKPPKRVVRTSLGFTFAQTSAMFVDRAIVLVATWVGGLASAGSLTVFQSVAALITAPVQAFSTALLNGKDSDRDRRNVIRLVIALAAGAALVGAAVLPITARLLWGEDYAFLGRYSYVVCLSGFLLAIWRTQQIQLRAMRRPSLVLISDLVSLAAAGTFASIQGLERGLEICLLGLVFAGTGCLTSLLVYKVVLCLDPKTPAVEVESSPKEPIRR